MSVFTYIVVHRNSGFVVLEHTWSKELWSSFTISRFTMENDDANALKGEEHDHHNGVDDDDDDVHVVHCDCRIE
jgi:hypothetical protein